MHPLFRVSFIESFSNINTVCSPNHIELFTPLPLNYKKEYLVCVGSHVCGWVWVGACVGAVRAYLCYVPMPPVLMAGFQAISLHMMSLSYILG